jgi:hypothetical protein
LHSTRKRTSIAVAVILAALLLWAGIAWGPRVVFRLWGSGTHLIVTVKNSDRASIGPLLVAVGGDSVRVPRLGPSESARVRLDSASSGKVVLIDAATGIRHDLQLRPGPGVSGDLDIDVVGGKRGVIGTVLAGLTYASGPLYAGGYWPFGPDISRP